MSVSLSVPAGLLALLPAPLRGPLERLPPWVLAAALAGAAAYAAIAASGVDRGALAMDKEQAEIAQLTVCADTGLAVERVTPARAAAAAAALASGLVDDPMACAVASERLAGAAGAPARGAALGFVLSTVLAEASLAQSGAVCLQTRGAGAVAVWYPNARGIDAGGVMLRGGWQFSFRYTGWERRGRMWMWSECANVRRLRLGPEIATRYEPGKARGAPDYYYLMLAAARADLEPARAAAELRSVLLPVLRLADSQGRFCYVECTDASARLPAGGRARLHATYTALGFRDVASEAFTLFGVDVRVMVRAPGAPIVPLAA